MRIRKLPLKGLGEWGNVTIEHHLEVFAGPKGTHKYLHLIKSDQQIMTYHIGDVIDADYGRTPGLNDLNEGRFFEVVGIEKGIHQSDDGKNTVTHTYVYTKPVSGR